MDAGDGPGRGRARLVGVAVVAVALALRLWNLGTRAQTVFDEAHYAFDAVAYLGGGRFGPVSPLVGIRDDSTPEHPRWASG